MAEKITYQPTQWKNRESPALNATNLNKIEGGINKSAETINTLIDELETTNERIDANVSALSDKASKNHSHTIVSEQSSGYMSSAQLAKLNNAESDIESLKDQLSKLKHDEDTAKDALTLDGHGADYFASKESLETLKDSIVPALEWNNY